MIWALSFPAQDFVASSTAPAPKCVNTLAARRAPGSIFNFAGSGRLKVFLACAVVRGFGAVGIDAASLQRNGDG
jgi:hypothetical protein